jgi:PAS domain S-box-containing protein
MSERLRVLVVEDSENDTALLIRQLSKTGFDPDHVRVETAEELEEALEREPWDVVLSDYTLPRLDAPTALGIVKGSGRDVPFIVISGTVGEDIAVQTMRAGAHDYLMKDQLTRLGEAIRREMRDARVREKQRRTAEELQRSAETWTETFDAISDMVCVISPDHEVLQINEAGCELIGLPGERIVGRRCYELVHGTDGPVAECPCLISRRTMRPATTEYEQDGRAYELDAWPILRPAGGIEAFVHIVKDVSMLRRTQRALVESERKYRALVEDMQDVVFMLDDQGRFEFVSSAARTFGYRPEEFLGRSFERFVHADDLAALRRSLARTMEGHVHPFEFRVYDAKGELRHVRVTSRPVVTDGETRGAQGVISDVTQQKRMEEQLRLAQKMEAIGQLAGGVAHDFNNLLTVINNYTRLALHELGSGPVHDDLEEVRKAGERAAALTRQLLAFSRKQVLRPEVLDLNAVVRGLESMLRRLLGEDVEIVVKLKEGLGSVEADPGQLEQVVMNLAVNARDAMISGGTLLIETDEVCLDEEYARRHVSVTPGRYVLLCVSDTGEGMDAATRERIFEPFFTTKGKGKGTGLGLATVYGIVKQSGGNIWVYSEPDHGTSFKIYLPRTPGQVAAAARGRAPEVVRGDETVLVVEDEQSVRRLIVRVLQTHGYRVLTAESGDHALEVCHESGDDIDLLLVDVVMPRMSGRELAGRLAGSIPELAVLYMSGYTDNAIVHHGVLEPGTRFIAKPFTDRSLARKVREVLDEGRRSQPSSSRGSPPGPSSPAGASGGTEGSEAP